MCARYGPLTEYNLLQKTYKISDLKNIQLNSKTVYPHHLAPVILNNDNGFEIELMSYSLVPFWSKIRKPKFVTYNARIEDITSKPTWKEPFKRKHCLVPMIHFFESAHFGSFAGNIIKIEAKDQNPLTAAGIWDEWIDPLTKEKVHSFAIITKEPPKDILEAGHDRCPLFLKSSGFKEWLDIPKLTTIDWKQFLMDNAEDNSFSFESVSKLKNFKPSTKNT